MQASDSTAGIVSTVLCSWHYALIPAYHLQVGRYAGQHSAHDVDKLCLTPLNGPSVYFAPSAGPYTGYTQGPTRPQSTDYLMGRGDAISFENSYRIGMGSCEDRNFNRLFVPDNRL